ncbi:MAG: alanine racemase [Bacteroidales bacterium]
MAKKSTKTTIVGQEGKNGAFIYSVKDVNSFDNYQQMLHFAYTYYYGMGISIIYTNSRFLANLTSDEVLAFELLNAQMNIKSKVHVGSFKTKMALGSLMEKCDTLQEFIDMNFFENSGSKVFFVFGDVQETRDIINYMRGNTSHTISEVNVKNAVSNINVYRRFIKPQTKLMVMLKADAYGCGMLRLGRFANMSNVDYIGVFSVDEGIQLRNNHVVTPIMVMNVYKENFELCLEYDLQPSIPNLELLKECVARVGEKQIGVHLKVDTGMARLGFDTMETFDEALEIINENRERIKVLSVYSHLACSEDPKKDKFTQNQFDQFAEYYKRAEDVLEYRVIRHILNSAGVLRFPQYQLDMVRSGIGLYGGINSMDDRLKVVRSLFSEIISIKNIKAGQPVGYGGVAVFDEDKTIAVVPVGYADGYRRSMGNGVGRVYINEHFVPTVGNICMDMFMIDVTGVDLKIGDKVEIYGQNISIEEIAEKWNTISYEVLTSSSQRANKKYIIDYSGDSL